MLTDFCNNPCTCLNSQDFNSWPFLNRKFFFYSCQGAVHIRRLNFWGHFLIPRNMRPLPPKICRRLLWMAPKVGVGWGGFPASRPTALICGMYWNVLRLHCNACGNTRMYCMYSKTQAAILCTQVYGILTPNFLCRKRPTL